ncbi:hypothetical protein F5Y12DRAFT_765123 [Xylaria sp. FL1777]|nr:hypothetical protein F5Y12DRAFT_765123 [Xylaria sp. FL1777]
MSYSSYEPGEEAPLVVPTHDRPFDHDARLATQDDFRPIKFINSPASALPIALLSALAVAATAATQIYTYANLLCKDAQHCNDSESRKFAASVAVATAVANVCALFSIRGFEALCKRYTRVGLAIWLLVRSFSVIALALGVFVGNIGIAMSSQVFEGLASDNILHFSLNSLYVRAKTVNGTSKLIGSSLALYMIGISLSPSIASLLGNFRYSFVMAYGLFLIAFLYLVVCVRVSQTDASAGSNDTRPDNIDTEAEALTPTLFSRISDFMAFPVLFVTEDYWRALPGLAILFYNSAQSYIFSALMVHTSVHFGFSSRENGHLLTIIHAVASGYLFMVLFLTPKVSAIIEQRKPKTYDVITPTSQRGKRNDKSRFTDASLALVSFLIQATALILVAIARELWQIYPISALLALGLACPGFVKSYFAASFESTSKPRALAYLAIMESCGSLIGPIVVGGLQAVWSDGNTFIVAACCVCFASILFLRGVIIDRRRVSHSEGQSSL